MKRVFAQDGQAVVRNVDGPELRKGEVLIETAYSAISAGTELWLLEGSADSNFKNHEYPTDPPSWPKTRAPIRREHPLPRPPDPGAISLGYSLAGRVLEVDGAVIDLRPGDLVAASGSQCAHHAELVSVPRSLVARVPEGVDLRDAALVTLGSIATTALRDTRCQFGETVVLYGLGLLGLLAAQVGLAAGYRIVGIEIDERRIELARLLGVTNLLVPGSDDVVEGVKAMTDGFGADSVIVGVKAESSEPINQAADMCRQRGRVVVQGLMGMNIERGRFFGNQVEIVPAVGYGLGRYDPVYEEGNIDYPIGLGRWTLNRNQEHFLHLISEGRIDTQLIAPVEVPIGRAADAYNLLQQSDRPPTVVLAYDKGNEPAS